MSRAPALVYPGGVYTLMFVYCAKGASWAPLSSTPEEAPAMRASPSRLGARGQLERCCLFKETHILSVPSPVPTTLETSWRCQHRSGTQILSPILLYPKNRTKILL